MARVTVVGAGYVGLVTGACFSEFGHSVICVDRDKCKINMLSNNELPIYEPGLQEIVTKNRKNGNFSVSSSLKDSIDESSIILLAVGTPTSKNGRDADLGALFNAVTEIAPLLTEENIIVAKSTVPVGTNRRIHRELKKLRPDINVNVVSNPEFLREGTAIEDFMRPDRIVIGAVDHKSIETMKELYNVLALREVPMVVCDWETAELSKYASNSFLAMKVSFINEIANLCESCGANVQQVAKIMGMDNRIGSKFLHPGPGYGGSCFPKDTTALASIGETYGSPQTLVESTISFNRARKKGILKRVQSILGNDIAGKKIALLGVAFKPETDDIRDAPSLELYGQLKSSGAIVSGYDPQAHKEFEKAKGLKLEKSWQAAVDSADLVVLLTEWNEFRGIDLVDLASRVDQPNLLDMRNVFNSTQASRANLHYVSIGFSE